MKKLLIIVGVVIIAVNAAVGAYAAEYTMRLSVSPPDSNPIGKGVRYLGEIIEKKSGGRIETQVFTGYSLTTGNEDQINYTRKNNIQMSVTVSSAFVGAGKGLENWYIFDYPYLFASPADVYKFAETDLYKKMCADLQKSTGLKAYPPYSQGLTKIGAKRAINTPDDMKNLKIRTTTSRLTQEMIRAWSGAPTPMAWGEVFTGLQQGTVDGVCTSSGMFDADKLYEVVGYMACIDPYPLLHVPFLNNRWFESLPEDLQKIVDECMYEYLDYERKLQDDAEDQVKQDMRANGMTVIEYDAETIKPFTERTAYIIDKYADMAGTEFVGEVKKILGK